MYFRGNTNMKLCFGTTEPKPIAYSDSGLAGDVDGRKCASCYLITHSGRAVAWQCISQKCAALNTTEAEFITVTKAYKDLLWMKNWLVSLGLSKTSMICFVKTRMFLIKLY
jgi:hypothetical protein